MSKINLINGRPGLGYQRVVQWEHASAVTILHNDVVGIRYKAQRLEQTRGPGFNLHSNQKYYGL